MIGEERAALLKVRAAERFRAGGERATKREAIEEQVASWVTISRVTWIRLERLKLIQRLSGARGGVFKLTARGRRALTTSRALPRTRRPNSRG